jgi:hypothetical protein
MSNNIEYVEPPEDYHGSHTWKNWHNFKYEKGGNFDANVLNFIQKKRISLEALIIACTGAAGSGKSFWVLRLAEILDPKFTVDQVAFGSEEFMALIGPNSPLGLGRVIILDESQFGMSSRDFYTNIQKDLMKQLEAIRSKGFIIFIVALSEAVLDVIARNYVLSAKAHMLKRGSARFYSYQMGPFSVKPYPRTVSKDCEMEMPGVESCGAPSCLKCPYSGLGRTLWKRRSRWKENGDIICENLRSQYERKKKEFVESMANESNEGRIAKKEIVMSKKITVDDAVAILRDNSTELSLSNQGNISRPSAELLLKKHYPGISERICIRAATVLSQDVLFCSKLSIK